MLTFVLGVPRFSAGARVTAGCSGKIVEVANWSFWNIEQLELFASLFEGIRPLSCAPTIFVCFLHSFFSNKHFRSICFIQRSIFKVEIVVMFVSNPASVRGNGSEGEHGLRAFVGVQRLRGFLRRGPQERDSCHPLQGCWRFVVVLVFKIL